MMKQPAVYILTNKRNGTLYIGATSHLIKRIYKHKLNLIDGFSKKYHTHRLVYYEQHDTLESAFLRERQVKQWKRDWKIKLIEQQNPYWQDLYFRLL